MAVELKPQWLSLPALANRRISYAQNFEDILLERAFPDRAGFYIDAGANDPVFQSVTKRFYDRGWSGINIEPQPGLASRLIDARPRDINLNCGVGSVETVLTYYEVQSVPGWSTFVPELGEQQRSLGHDVIERPIPIRKLAEICAEHVQERTIDFLKIDVEGFEREVILGADWSRWRPRVVIVETYNHQHWEPLLIEANYRFLLFDGINRFYVRAEEYQTLAPAFSTPVTCLDLAVPYEYSRLIEELQDHPAQLLIRKQTEGGRRWLRNRHPRVARFLKQMLTAAGYSRTVTRDAG